MKFLCPAFVLMALFSASCGERHLPVGDENRIKSRQIVDEFEKRLKGELQQALSSGTPADAIYVCQNVAPGIADELSRKAGAKVSRVSRRFRNPVNAPEPWQAEVLAQFERSSSSGEQPSEYCCDVDRTVRYMKAIHVGPLCLACHGTTLAPGVEQALDAAYPHDRARGYEAGDLRGAFSVTWPESHGAQ